MTTGPAMTNKQAALVDRVRDALAAEDSTREVAMFGGLSFMVHDAMVVAAGREGDLLVRIDPGRHDELITHRGAAPAEMGAGRSMGPSWIRVARDGIVAGEELSFWIDVALEYNATSGG